MSIRLDIYDKPLKKAKTEVSYNVFSYLLAEFCVSGQSKSNSTQIEQRLHRVGKSIGARTLELVVFRDRNPSCKRDNEVVSFLSNIVTNCMWKTLFGSTPVSLQKAAGDQEQYLITDEEPLITKYISHNNPSKIKVNCNAFVAGIIEGAMNAANFPATVSAHFRSTDKFPMKTTYLITMINAIDQV
eukprot:TRINITY_DN2109_c0_g1_i1.p1 TRINITY_DN2109_c0_g1~~TRINITY_DN2109_c0_g1_i1.p1  ORF type:complete len:200 (+),score=46.07 TRINITY_DN2109_c0_g1_i1:44-601(+)